MIYIYTNSYEKSSNGITLMYELVDFMNKHSFCAKNLIYEELYPFDDIPEKYKQNCILLSKGYPEITSKDIVIYCEIITDNPLKAKNVVRYLLNKPKCLTGVGIEYGNTDYLIAYNRLIDKTVPNVFFMRDETAIFDRIRGLYTPDNNTVSIYFGKVQYGKLITKFKSIYPEIKKFSKINVITRYYPDTREETLRQVRSSSLLISFDPLTNLNYEATLLNVPVLLMDNLYNEDKDYNIKSYGMTDSLYGIDKAKKEVFKAYDEYKNYLNNQEQLIIEEIKKIYDHFDRIRTNYDYRETVEQNNKKRIEIDNQNYSVFSGIKLRNICTYEDLPKYILRKLELTHSKLSKKQKLFSILASLHLYDAFFKLYGMIKR